jgi:ribosomal protein S18 acetylase RimI-like enzyme
MLTADLLVKLYELAPAEKPLPEGMSVRRAFAAEKRLVAQWVAGQFGERWASECEISFMRSPVACFIATNGLDVLGFASYDATARGFFGPTGVAVEARHKGIGRALLDAALRDMAAQGYAYGIIGATTSLDFYRHEVNAIPIPDSSPGFYEGMLMPNRG